MVSLPNGILKKFEKYFSSDHLHKKITWEEVDTIVIAQQEAADESKRTQLVGWFNQAGLVEEVKIPGQQEKEALIQIDLTNGEKIRMSPYKNDFLVVRSGESHMAPVIYWAKQGDISRLMAELQREGEVSYET